MPYLITVWFLVTLNFVLPRTMLGDPIEAMPASSASTRSLNAEEKAAAARTDFDRALWEQCPQYWVP